MANLSTTMTLHIELSGLDRELLERVCENLEWYRKHLQEQAQLMQAEQEQARKRWEGEQREAEKEMKGHLLDKMGRD